MRMYALLAGVMMACGLAWSEAMTLEVVQKKLAAEWENTEAFHATMLVHMDMMRKGIRMTSDMAGPILFARTEDGKVRQRSRLEGKVGGGPMNLLQFDTRVLSVSDGETTWNETHAMGKVRVVKTTARSARRESDTKAGGGAEALAEFNEQYNLRLLPQRKHEGRDVYVIEGRPRPEQKEKMPDLDRVLLFFDQKTAIMTTVAMLDADNKPLIEVKFQEVRTNPEIAPEAFSYTPPPGAEVTDKTEEPAADSRDGVG